MTKRSHSDFMQAMRDQGRVISAIWTIYTLTIFGYMHDVLHAVDLGVACHITANIFIEAMADGVFGDGNQDARLEHLQNDLVQYYNDNKDVHRIAGELGFSRIRTSGEWPKLKAKGAQTRHICRYALKLAQENNKGTEHDNDRLVVIQLLCKYYDILESDGMFHSNDSKKI